MIEKMCFVNIIGYTKDIDRVVEKYICKYDMQLEHALNRIERNDLEAVKTSDLYNNLAKKARKILEQNDNLDQKDNINNNLLISKDEAIEIIEQEIKLGTENNNLVIDNLVDKINKVKELIFNLGHFKNLDFDYELLAKLKFINYKFGRMPMSNYMQYKTFLNNEKEIFVVEGEEYENYIWFVYFTTREDLTRVDEIFLSFNFEPVEIPDKKMGELDLSGNIIKILADLEKYLLELEGQKKELETKKNNNNESSGKKIAAAKKILKLKNMDDTKKFCAIVANDFFIFTGWVTKKIFFLLDSEIKDDELVMIVSDNEIKENPPIILKNNFLFKPFELLVKMYGVPCYYEIDPTPFFAITYSVLFGLMFGDVGQGFVLFLSGLILNKKNKSDLYQILSRLGFSSMIFGFLYGSIFGFEDIIKNIWLKPSDNITYILLFTVAMGIFLILFSMVFNLINSKKKNKLLDIILGPNSLSGLVFYSSVIALSLIKFTGFLLNSIWIKFLGVLAIISLFFIAFSEPIKKLLRGEKKIFGSNIFLFLFETVIELFETLLSYFTNTVSFVRVGAFALSHAGMMSVVMLLAKNNYNNYNWFVVVLGNILVIALEGLIVGIQVLRLEFYEMFGRFFRGTGREYVSKTKNIS